MRIGIIGTGSIGGTFARKLTAAGHDVRVANSRGPEGVRQFADEIGAKAVDVHGAVDGVDVIVLAIPLPAMRGLPADLFDSVPPEVTIIDTSNYYPDMRDPRISEIDAGMVESVWVSKQLGRSVIKAFNNVLAYTLAHLGRPEGTPDRLAIAVAGDDVRCKQIAMELVNQTGFDPVDVSDFADCEKMVAHAVAQFGGLHVAFNNAGIPSAIGGEFEDFSLQDWRRLLDVNLSGVFFSMKAEVPALKASGGTAIINTASVASLVAAPGMAAYVASKHGVAGLTKAAALDLIPYGIRVNALCPGAVDTAMLASAAAIPSVRAQLEASAPIGRIASAEEVARTALFLASEDASYMVGTLLSVDGGVVAR